MIDDARPPNWQRAKLYEVLIVSPWTGTQPITICTWPCWYLAWRWVRSWALARLEVHRG